MIYILKIALLLYSKNITIPLCFCTLPWRLVLNPSFCFAFITNEDYDEAADYCESAHSNKYSNYWGCGSQVDCITQNFCETYNMQTHDCLLKSYHNNGLDVHMDTMRLDAKLVSIILPRQQRVAFLFFNSLLFLIFCELKLIF